MFSAPVFLFFGSMKPFAARGFMELTEKALREFAQLWQEDHPDQYLSQAELTNKASRVLRAFELVYRPIPQDKLKVFASLTNTTHG